MPGKKETNQPTEPAAETAEHNSLSQELGLDEISNAETKREVINYFEGKKEDIKGVTSGKLEQLKDAMRKMERQSAGSDKIIEEILQTLFSTHLNENIRMKYADEFALAVLNKNINFEGNDDTKAELNANPVYTKARTNVLNTIKAGVLDAQKIGKFIKPKYVDQYAGEVFGKYVKNMDEDIYGRVSESNVSKDLHPMTFSDWRASHLELTDKELFLDLSITEAKEFALDIAGIKKEMDKINPAIPGLNPKLSSYFANEKSKLHEESLNRPDNLRLVQQEAAKLAGSFAAAVSLAEFQKGVKEKLNEVIGLKDKFAGLDATIEPGYKKVLANIDAAIAKFMENKDDKSLTVDPKEKSDLDAKLALEKQKVPDPGTEAAAAAETEKEEAKKINPLEDPAGFFKNLFKDHPIIASMLSMLGMDKMFDKIAQNPAMQKMRALMAYAGKSKEQIEKINKELIPKFVKFADEKFGIKKNGAELLAKMKVSAVLKLTRSPMHVDENQFNAFKAGLEENGAEKGYKGLVIDFMETKFGDWKVLDKAAPVAAAPVA